MKKFHLPLLLLCTLLAACNQLQPTSLPSVVQTSSAWTSTPTPTYKVIEVTTPAFTPSASLTETATSAFTSSLTASMPALLSTITASGGWGHITHDIVNAAFYMEIHNSGYEMDRLIGATSPMCARVGLQQMGNKYGADIPLIVNIPAGTTVYLQFGGYRLVCHDISGGMGLGSTVPLTLIFERFGSVDLTVEIREPPE